METPKKPLKKPGAGKKTSVKKTDEPSAATKPKSKFIDEEEDEFDAPIDDLGAFDHFDGLEEDDDY